MPDLTVKEHAFVNEYLKHGVGNKAVIDAGYSASGASVTANRLLKRAHVAAEIALRRLPIEKKSAMTAERVIRELSNIAFFDPASMYDATGKLLSIKEMPEETRRAIAGVEEHLSLKGDTTKKLRISSKLGSLELAAKLLGMIKDQQDQKVAVQIIIGQPPVLPELEPGAESPQLLPSW